MTAFTGVQSKKYAFLQLKMEMTDSRLKKALAASRAGSTALLEGLPAVGFNRTTLDNNAYFMLQDACNDIQEGTLQHWFFPITFSSITPARSLHFYQGMIAGITKDGLLATSPFCTSISGCHCSRPHGDSGSLLHAYPQ